MSNNFSVASLAGHPRLYLGKEEQARLRRPFKTAILKQAAAGVTAKAEEYLAAGPIFEWEVNTHNAHLIRARNMQTRVVTLLVEWQRSGDSRFRDAALDHLLEMGRWDVWSWITWREGNYAADAIFDLSYGENCATVAIGYDWLCETLNADEKKAILAVVERPLAAFMKHSAPDSRMWWYGKRDSNWNTVCAGGAGMLALAFYEEMAEAPVIIERAVDSIGPFVDEIKACNGAWPEGIGYWNYGMRYLFMFALSMERATGKKLPWMGHKAVRESLMFPLVFTPYAGVPCSFGDANAFSPLPFHFAVARRLKEDKTVAALAAALDNSKIFAKSAWPNEAELLSLFDGKADLPKVNDTPFMHHYKGQDWVVMADRMPQPELYVSLRGGTTEVPHNHIDLTSFHAVIGGEKIISNIGPSCYLDTTFSARRWELFEMVPMSKNVLLVDGAGIRPPATVTTRCTMTPWGPATRFEAAEALGRERRANDGVLRYHRLFLLMPGFGLLVVDNVKRPNPSLFEQRFMTQTTVNAFERNFVLQGELQGAVLTCACTEETTLFTGDVPLTRPLASVKQPYMMRQITNLLHREVVMVALLTSGKRVPALSVRRGERESVEVVIGSGKTARVIKMSRDLVVDRNSAGVLDK